MRHSNVSWIKILSLAAAMLVVLNLSMVAFGALPRSMRLYSDTTRFSVGYLAWLGIVVLAALECMRRSRRAVTFFLLGWSALVLSFAHAVTYPISTIYGSVRSAIHAVYNDVQAGGFLVFLIFFSIRGFSIIKRQMKEPK